MNTAEVERQKYEKMWACEAYYHHSPGECLVDAFLDIAKPENGEKVIELGCGTARAGVALQKASLDVKLLDFVDIRKGKAKKLPFINSCLWHNWSGLYDYGYCVDVMEHIPPEYTMLTIERIMSHCPKVFFHICLIPDSFGRVIGQPLHLTVMPFLWWKDRLKDFGTILDCRDLLANGLYYVER